MKTTVQLESRPANRWPQRFNKQKIANAIRIMAPTFFALTFASVAHAQGTMDFSGAQTLMGTFKSGAKASSTSSPKPKPCLLHPTRRRKEAEKEGSHTHQSGT